MKSTVVYLALLAALAVASAQVAKIPTGYNVIARTGDAKLKTPEGLVFGQVYDKSMKPVLDSKGAITVAHNPDFTSIHKVCCGMLDELPRLALACALRLCAGINTSIPSCARADWQQDLHGKQEGGTSGSICSGSWH